MRISLERHEEIPPRSIHAKEMIVKRIFVLGIVAVLFAGTASGQNAPKPSTPESVKADQETRYLAFQIFTYFSPDPKVASLLSNGLKETLLPGKPALRDYVLDVKTRIGTVGDEKTRLAVVLGPLCFEQSDSETTKFIELAFDLALETDVVVGFHIDDSIFWSRRKDLWSDPKNVEALDWDGTPCVSRRLDWGKKPTEAPPQMCFNSKAIQREVRERSVLIGKAIQAGVKTLQDRKRPDLFAGVIAGWETMIGQDLKTGKYLGYRAMLNRGFSRENPPKDMDLEREKVVQEFIELWTSGLAEAGVSPEKIYSHTAFLSRRAFKGGDDKEITYMKNDKGNTYTQHNHFAPPSVAFGKNHRPGFSTYPQPGLFDDVYDQLARHKQVAWASCEGTNMQPSSGPGQTGMNMETYLAKTFNHGGTLVNVFAWGIGGEAMKNMDFRMVTEGEDALRAYRKFLSGSPLIEAQTQASLMERLPPKIHRIQKELPGWIEKAEAGDKEKATALMKTLETNLKAKNFEEVEKTADSILKMMGLNAQDVPKQEPQKPDGSTVADRLPPKIQKIQEGLPAWVEKTGNAEKATGLMKKLDEQLKAKNFEEAEKTADSILKMMGTDAPAAGRELPKEALKMLRHELGGSFLVSRDKVQEELKLTKEQKAKLEQQLRELLPDAIQFFQKLNGLTREEREKELRTYRPKAREKMTEALKDTLNEGQRTRLRQLELQREGLFGSGEIWKELEVTDEQRQQFMEAIQRTGQEIEALLQEVRKNGNPDEIRPKVMKLREGLQGKLEALLTDAQKTQWKEMLGKKIDPSALFDDLSSR
jgi:hypothetical protein